MKNLISYSHQKDLIYKNVLLERQLCDKEEILNVKENEIDSFKSSIQELTNDYKLTMNNNILLKSI